MAKFTEEQIVTFERILNSMEDGVVKAMAWYERFPASNDYVILMGDYNGALKVIENHKDGKVSFNFSGLGVTATAYSKVQCERFVALNELEKTYQNVRVVKRADYIREFIASQEASLADLRGKLEAGKK